MPNFRITAPDGTQYNVTGPDGATEQDALAQVQAQHSQAPAQPQASAAEAPLQDPSVMDRLRANPVVGAPLQTVLRAGQGIEQLAAHGAASLSDLGGLAPNPVSRALRGVSGRVDQAINSQNQGYESAGARVDAASTNPRASKAFRSTGEIMGNMLNPAGMAGNAIEAAPGLVNAGLRGAASGAGFGASQPVLNDENYWLQKGEQTAAGAATGTATGTAAAALGGEKLRPNQPPTTKELKAQASNAYKAAEAEGVVIKHENFKQTVGDISEALQKEGLDSTLHPKTTAVLNRFQTEAANGDLTLEKAETLRRVASSALDSPDKSDKRLAHIVIDKLDDFIGGLKPGDVRGGVTGDPKLIEALNLPTGNAETATTALSKARDLYSRSAKSATIDRLVERAKNATGANYTQAGYETAIRQQFRSLANNDRAMRRFSPDEKAAIQKVVRGGPVENVLRWAGKLAVRGPVSGAPAGFALYSGSPEIAATIAGAGEVGRFGGSQLAQRNVRLAQELMRRGGNNPSAPLPRPAPNTSVGDPATALMIQALLKPRVQ